MVFPSWLRLVLGFMNLGVAAFALAHDDMILGLVALFVGLVFLHAWFRYSDVPRAAHAFNHGDRERAWALLERIPAKGRFLARPYRIYYHQVRSSCLAKWGRWQEAVGEASAVLELGPADPQLASSHATLARAYAHLGEREKAAEHLASARSTPHEKVLDRRLDQIAHMLGRG